MKRLVKNVINRAVRRWSLELTYSHLVVRHETRLDWLRNLNILTVLDVGANDGEFAADIAGMLPDAHVISFEPLRDVYEALIRKCSGPRFTAYNFALGEEETRAEIRRSAFSPSSSLLTMDPVHVEAFPHTRVEGVEQIEVRRLDSLHLQLRPNVLVKLDVQGYEDRVIRGGRETISRAAVVICEVSFEPLYVGQALFDDINCQFRDLGFRYRGSWLQLPDPRDGHLLQADAIFVRA